ncbi:MAG: glycosyltransferase family 2 protein [Elusimicrobia bacterium]|nr:glycosyltransferase family 2 protein [Elusimicrobiota bacterium]
MMDRLCFGGLRLNAGRRIELVIVDDASPLESETVAVVRAVSDWADVIYHRNQSNLGYVRSANKGFSLATGSYLLLCNSDTRLSPGALDRLIEAIDADSRMGMAGPVTNGAFNSKLQTANNLPVPLKSFSDTEIARFDEFGRALALQTGRFLEAGWLLGFCAMIRREVFESIGGLDEGFGFGYLEEVDYAIRMRRAGWKLAVVPNAFVFHGGLLRSLQFAGPNAGSQTNRSFPLRTFFWITKGLFYLVRKYGWKAVGIPQDAGGAAERGF